MPAPSLERMAADLVVAMRAVQPAGAFHLAGHCFGAVLAFEAAHQLHAAGDEVGVLALLDITPWDFQLVPQLAWRTIPGRSRPGGRRAASRHRLREARRAGVRRGTARLGSAALNVPRYLSLRRGRRVTAYADDAVVRANRQACADYRPRPFPGPALLVLAEESAARYTDDPAADWAGLADQVEVHILEGGYADMLTEPSVADLAVLIDVAVRGESAAQTVP